MRFYEAKKQFHEEYAGTLAIFDPAGDAICSDPKAIRIGRGVMWQRWGLKIGDPLRSQIPWIVDWNLR